MENLKRSPFQGVVNIIKFNWHIYIIAIIVLLIMTNVALLLPAYRVWFYSFAALMFLSINISLLVSYYVYDYSSFYALKWLDKLKLEQSKSVINITAGFDETSSLLINKLKPGTFMSLDFYDEEKHTEVSIKRARKAGLVYPGTKECSTMFEPVVEKTADYVFFIFSLHEVRDKKECIASLINLKQKLKLGGQIIVVEHMRDWKNFLAYNIGFLHFYSRNYWLRIFNKSALKVTCSTQINPFVNLFILE